MTIESIVRDRLGSLIAFPVTVGMPEEKPPTFITIEKTGGSERGHVERAIILISCFAPSMFAAAETSKAVKTIMLNLVDHPMIGNVEQNSEYNASDSTRNLYRYKSLYEITML